MNSEWDSLLATVEEKRVTLSLSDLPAVREERGLLRPSEEIRSSCRVLRRMSLRHLESEGVAGVEEAGLSELWINGLTTLAGRMYHHKDEGWTARSSAVAPPIIDRTWYYTSTGFITTEAKTNRDSVGTRNNVKLHPMDRKDFKMTGQIGEMGQKDKLNFTGLVREIERGVQKGFDEGEIVEAVIQSIVPEVRLKSYLENCH